MNNKSVSRSKELTLPHHIIHHRSQHKESYEAKHDAKLMSERGPGVKCDYDRVRLFTACHEKGRDVFPARERRR
jgi:hypothetical protein